MNHYALAFAFGVVLTGGTLILVLELNGGGASRLWGKTFSRSQKTGEAGRRSLGQLLALPDKDLDKVDVLELNLAVAREVPGLGKLDYDRYERIVDEWANRFARRLPSVEAELRRAPDKWKNDIRFLRLHKLCEFLRSEAGVTCIDEGKALKGGRRNAGDWFLSGVVDRRQGGCSNIPALLVAIGRRLGWPVSLAVARSHYVCRYDDGEVIYNVSATGKGPGGLAVWTDAECTKNFGVSGLARKSGSDLRSLSARETAGAFVALRARYFSNSGRPALADRDYALARVLFPTYRWAYVASVRPFLWRGSRLFAPTETGHPNSLAGILGAGQGAPSSPTGRGTHRDPLAELKRIEAMNRANRQRLTNPPGGGPGRPPLPGPPPEPGR